MSGKRNSYTANFKLQGIAFAESINDSMAFRHFSVNDKNLSIKNKLFNRLLKIFHYQHYIITALIVRALEFTT